MSLGEKLSKISQNLQETKTETEKENKEKELEPIRARIKDLENKKHELELVKGSLELVSSETTGKGMKEYATDTAEKDTQESSQLDTLVEKNKEALQTMDIENKDQLVQNPEFAEEPEVVSYKNAKKQTEDLQLSDIALQEKLKTLGIDTSVEGFSYTSVEQAIVEKLQLLDGELVQEKLKTPEGKEEAIRMLVEKLEKSIPQTSFSVDQKTNAKVLELRKDYQNKGTITISGEKTKFEGWNNRLIPKEADDLEKTYGTGIVKEVTKKAYENKIQNALDQLDKESKFTDKDLQTDLERSSPEKWSEASKVIREFEDLSYNLKKVLNDKWEEMKAKGIDFSPTYVPHYAMPYKDIAVLVKGDFENQMIDQTKNNPTTYPPLLNFDALKDYTEKRIVQIKELTENIKKIETEADIDTFARVNDSQIRKAHNDVLKTRFDDVSRPRHNIEQTKAEGLMKFKSYEEAMDYFEKKSLEKEATKQKFLQAIEDGMDAQIKAKELQEDMADKKFGSSISRIEDQVANIDRDKKEALEIVSELIKLQSELPEEEVVVLNGITINVPSVGKQLEQLREKREAEEENLKKLEQKIHNKEQNKPSLFGKDKWANELAELEQEKKDLREKIGRMENSDRRKLLDKHSFQIPVGQYSRLRELVFNKYDTKGTPKEIFENLKKELSEIANRKAPESVMKLYTEYKGLEKKLSQQ